MIVETSTERPPVPGGTGLRRSGRKPTAKPSVQITEGGSHGSNPELTNEIIDDYKALMAIDPLTKGLDGITVYSAFQNGYDTAKEQGHKPGTREFEDAALIATVGSAKTFEIPFRTKGQKQKSTKPKSTLPLNSPEANLDNLYPDDPNDPEPTPEQIPELQARVKKARQFSDGVLVSSSVLGGQNRQKEISRGDSVIAPNTAEDFETRKIGLEALALHGLISPESAAMQLGQMEKVRNAGSPSKQDSVRARILQDYDPRGLGEFMQEVDPATGQLQRRTRVGRGQSDLSDEARLTIAKLFHEDLKDQTVEDENGQIQVVLPARENTLRNQRIGINPTRTTSFEAGMKRPSDALNQIEDSTQTLNELSGHPMAPLVRGATSQDPEYGSGTYADGSKAPSVYDIGKAEAEKTGKRFAVNPLPNYEPPELAESGIPDMTFEEKKATRRNFSLASDEDLVDLDESGLPDIEPLPGETQEQLRQRIKDTLRADRIARDTDQARSAKDVVDGFVRPEKGSAQDLRDTLQDAIQHAHEITRIHANEIDEADDSFYKLGNFHTTTGDTSTFGQVGESVDGESFDDKIYSGGGGSGDAEAPVVNGPQYESNHLKATRYFARLQQDEDHAYRVQENAKKYASSLTDDDIDQWVRDNFPNGATEDQLKNRFVAHHLESISGMQNNLYPMDANPFAVRGREGYSIPRDILASNASADRSQERGTASFVIDAAKRGELGKLNSQYNRYEARSLQSADVQNALDYLEQIKQASTDYASLYTNTRDRAGEIAAKMLASDQQKQLETERSGLPAVPPQESTDIDLSSVDDVVNKVLGSEQMANVKQDALAFREIERDARRQFRKAGLSYEAEFGEPWKPASASAAKADPDALVMNETANLEKQIADLRATISKTVSPARKKPLETELRKLVGQYDTIRSQLNQKQFN